MGGLVGTICLNMNFVFGRFTDLISATLIEVSSVRKMAKQPAELLRDWISVVSRSTVYMRREEKPMSLNLLLHL